MDNKEIASRLRALGLSDLIEEVGNPGDYPYPLPKRRILRLLEVAATKFTEKSTEIMALHDEIQADEAGEQK